MHVCHARFPISKTNSATVFTDKPITSRREIENILRMLALDVELFDDDEAPENGRPLQMEAE